MMSLVAVGVLILSALSIVCFAAYKIRAKSFEVSTSVGKFASFSIKIIPADAEDGESARDRIELLGKSASWASSNAAQLLSGAELGGAVAVGDAYEEVADPGNQARRQAEKPHANGGVLDHDVPKQEDQDPKPPRQFYFPPTPHTR